MPDAKENLLRLLSMDKYSTLLQRMFPGAHVVEVLHGDSEPFWQLSFAEVDGVAGNGPLRESVIAWDDFGADMQRREASSDYMQYRSPLVLREQGKVAWLRVTYRMGGSIPLSTAMESLRRSFADAKAFLRQELELQAECNQLARELTERYEELNLVYSTKDQVEHPEDGQEALAQLVHNCADYLDVGFAALICRDRDLCIHEARATDAPQDIESALETLATTVYDHVESQVQCLIVHHPDDPERRRLFGGRCENLLAYPVVDDYGTTVGMLAVVARKGRHVFSNGDRNLLEVMAKKASRIIHTHHDPLTGLVNRSGFEAALVSSLASTQARNLHHCLLHIDVDQLHVVNDLMGFQEGDNLIRRIAKLLRGILRDSDFLSRLGGDEFAVLLTKCDLRHAELVAEKIRDAIHDLTVVSASKQLSVTVSIGIVGVSRQTEGIMTAMASAEIACKSAKEGGNDRIQVFEIDNSVLVQRSEEIEWIARLQHALRDDCFQLYCQPVMPLNDDGHAPHYEVLIRMLDHDGALLSPGLFLPAAERYQLMPMMDRWVIRHTFECLKENWKAVETSGAVFCINLSGQSLTNSGFLRFIADELQRSGIAAERVCFEITETAAISNIDEARMFIGELQRIGCRFALDDFGAGLSSFGYLKVLPVNYLKIDGSFVREITSDQVSRSMVEAIYQIGRSMGLEIIAEFVGDQATVDALREIGVDYGQGYFIGKPAPIMQIIDQLPMDASEARA